MTKILVIEDEEALREGISDILVEIGGYEVLLAADGRVGIELAQENVPDLILCDVQLPEYDGFEVLQVLKEDKRLSMIPFIFVTSRSDRAATRYGMSLGADDYITKPFLASELLAAIEARLNKQELIASQYEAKMESLRGNILLALPHELRTPLAGIIGYGELLTMEIESMSRDDIKNIAESIAKAGRRLHRLIENYIIIAQMELVKSDPDGLKLLREQEQIKPDEVLKVLVYELRPRYDGREITLDLQTADTVLNMARENFGKMVEELLDNAFKFSAAHTPVVMQSWLTADNEFQLTISDQGRGMSPEQVEAVGLYMQFERRIHEQQGAGMGLAIAQRMAELHNGRLTIESAPGVGTAVTITIPL